MLGAQHKSRTPNSALVPMVCEVCRSHRSKPSSLSSSSPAIDALRRLEPQPAISARTPDTVVLVSEPKPNRQFAHRGCLSSTSVDSPLSLLPANKYCFHTS